MIRFAYVSSTTTNLTINITVKSECHKFTLYNLSQGEVTAYIPLSEGEARVKITQLLTNKGIIDASVKIGCGKHTAVIGIPNHLLLVEDKSGCPKHGTALVRFIDRDSKYVSVDVGKRCVNGMNMNIISGGIYTVFSPTMITHDNNASTVAVAQNCEKTVKDFDIVRFSGMWYVHCDHCVSVIYTPLWCNIVKIMTTRHDNNWSVMGGEIAYAVMKRESELTVLMVTTQPVSNTATRGVTMTPTNTATTSSTLTSMTTNPTAAGTTSTMPTMMNQGMTPYALGTMLMNQSPNNGMTPNQGLNQGMTLNQGLNQGMTLNQGTAMNGMTPCVLGTMLMNQGLNQGMTLNQGLNQGTAINVMTLANGTMLMNQSLNNGMVPGQGMTPNQGLNSTSSSMTPASSVTNQAVTTSSVLNTMTMASSIVHFTLIIHDTDYKTFAVVGTPTRVSSFILTRSKKLCKDDTKRLRHDMTKIGY